MVYLLIIDKMSGAGKMSMAPFSSGTLVYFENVCASSPEVMVLERMC